MKELIAFLCFLCPNPDYIPLPVLKAVAPEMKKIAVQCEVLEDNTSATYWFRPDYKYTTWVDGKSREYWEVREDLRNVRKSLLRLRYCPPLWAADSLPPQQYLREQIDFNFKYQEYLKGQLSFYSDTHYQFKNISKAIEETERLYKIYDKAYYCTLSGRDKYNRRMDLKDLAELIGGENLKLGRLPPPVPLEYFSRRD